MYLTHIHTQLAPKVRQQKSESLATLGENDRRTQATKQQRRIKTITHDLPAKCTWKRDEFVSCSSHRASSSAEVQLNETAFKLRRIQRSGQRTIKDESPRDATHFVIVNVGRNFGLCNFEFGFLTRKSG